MAEFGENIRKAREKLGITQQTLADKLYVTRQAVSRWENGSRYPDLLTSKSLAKALDTSLDELLRDDDMRTYPEVNPVLEYPLHKRVQTALFSAAFAINLIQALWFIFYNLTENRAFQTGYETTYQIIYAALHVLISAALLYGAVKSVKDGMTPKAAAFTIVSLIGIDMLSLCMILIFGSLNYSLISWQAIAILLVLDAVFIILVLRYYFAEKARSPIAIYIFSGLVIVSNIVSYIGNLLQVIGTADLRKYLTNSTLEIIATLIIQILFIYMTAVLHRKRRIAKETIQ